MTAAQVGTGQLPLVQMTGVTKHFPIQRGVMRRTVGHVRAVDGVDMTIPSGSSMGLVGESGSGKSTLGRLMLRLIEPTSGTIMFEDSDVTRLKARSLRRIRRHMQMVFQDPYSSMDPRSSVGDSVAEPLRTQLGLRGRELDERVADLFRLVRLSPTYRGRYPNEFSGGQLQRIAVARALATNPKLVVCDEPVSSLDVSTKAEVINLLADLQDELGIAYLFIAHDLGVVRHVSDRIGVMYLGRLVEEGDAEAVYSSPKHPYTQALLSAIPVPDPVVQRSRTRIVLEGDLPSPANPPSGCHFHTRCPYVMDVCRAVDPPLAVTSDGTRVFCHLIPPTGAEVLVPPAP
ncbi:MAG: ABC transporter ATP-binding protein [Acidobacteria bacterium]|nr:ABC transporter ATP-binding protein [Acidobacteriota bacterium]